MDKPRVIFTTPYSFKKDFFEAYDYYMSLLQDDDDWMVFLDGDMAFLLPEWGHQIREYIKKYPDTGLFTCYANRCAYDFQIRKGTERGNPSILYHYYQALKVKKELDGQVKEINEHISGYLMAIKKSTWNDIRDEVARRVNAEGKRILGVDTKISNTLLAKGYKIRLMRGIYIYHYYRLAQGAKNKSHLV